MPRQQTDPFWVEQIRTLAANRPQEGAPAITRELQKIADGLEKGHPHKNAWPCVRTVGRILREFRQLPASEQIEYRYLYWPESMVRGELPWEAAPYALEVLRHLSPAGWRPLIRMVRWFYFVSLAAPDAPYDDRSKAAGKLAALEVLGRLASDDSRPIEWYLAYAPWRSDQNRAAYESKVKDGFIRRFHGTGITIPEGTDLQEGVEALEALMGIPLPWAKYVLRQKEEESP